MSRCITQRPFFTRVTAGKPRETPGNSGKLRETPGNPGNSGKLRETPGNFRETPGNSGKLPGNPRETSGKLLNEIRFCPVNVRLMWSLCIVFILLFFFALEQCSWKSQTSFHLLTLTLRSPYILSNGEKKKEPYRENRHHSSKLRASP